MGRIQVLESALADQIAAGEVVERPASVVKELVENALDAGATNIQVDLDDSGVGRIEVRDDGAGMDAEDAVLAVQRHATSKLRQFADLLELRTMGFRGEALASIASVSKLELRTRTKDVDVGTQVRVEGGAPADVRPVGCPVGTLVRVEQLFFNVPARRKFLKSEATENGRVTQVLRRVALANPGLRLRLVRDGRTALELLPATDLSHRLKQVFPKDRFLVVDGKEHALRVRAWLGQASAAQSGTSHLHLFVNRRPVQDAKLAKAIASAYRDTLPGGKYPAGVVFLELPPSAVDVNVHPQKAEVRFAEEAGLLRDLGVIVSTALLKEEQARFTASRPKPAADAVPARSTQFWDDRLGLGALEHGEKVGTATAYRQGREVPRSARSEARQEEPSVVFVRDAVRERTAEPAAPAAPSHPSTAPRKPAPRPSEEAVEPRRQPAAYAAPRAAASSRPVDAAAARAPSARVERPSTAKSERRTDDVPPPGLEARIGALLGGVEEPLRGPLAQRLAELVRSELERAVDALEHAARELRALGEAASASRLEASAAQLRQRAPGDLDT